MDISNLLVIIIGSVVFIGIFIFLVFDPFDWRHSRRITTKLTDDNSQPQTQLKPSSAEVMRVPIRTDWYFINVDFSTVFLRCRNG